MKLQAYLLEPGRAVRDVSATDALEEVIRSLEGRLWVDVEAPDLSSNEFFKEWFGFHEVSLVSCTSPGFHPPRLEDYGDHAFILYHGIDYSAGGELVETAELGMFLGDRYIVTMHKAPLYAVDAVADRVKVDGGPMRKGVDFLAHAILEAVTLNIVPTLDRMVEVADELEGEALTSPTESTIEAILRLKRSTLRILRVLGPQQEVVEEFSRDRVIVTTPDVEPFLRDVAHRLVRLEGSAQILRERANGFEATYLAALAIRQNQTVKALTIITAIFLPLTLVAGIYGMNFPNMPEMEWRWGYYYALGLMTVIALAGLWLAWGRDWLRRSRIKEVRKRLFEVSRERLMGFRPGR